MPVVVFDEFSGGILVGGIAGVGRIMFHTATGGIIGSGTSSIVKSYNPPASGGVIGGGVVGFSYTSNPVILGGAIAGGQAFEELLIGGLIVSGAAGAMAFYSPAISAGAVCNNSAGVDSFQNILGSAAGLAVGGSAFEFVEIDVQGGAACSGEASVPPTSYVMQGGVLGSGNSVPYGITNEPPNGIPQGGLKVAGVATQANLRMFFYIPDGGVEILGRARGGLTQIRYNASGGIVLDATEEADVNFSFDLAPVFLWQTRGLIEREIELLWNTGQLQIFWYRVIGRGRSGNVCPPLQADPCCQKFILNVHARTLAELCEKLQKRRYKFPIESVQRFSRPAENAVVRAEEEAGANHDCNKLEPVEICDIPQCADFCVEHDLTVSFGFGMRVQVDAFFFAESDGAIFLSGTAGVVFAPNQPHFVYEAAGGLALTGEAAYEPNSFTMRGGIVAEGKAFTQFSRWEYVGGIWPDTSGLRLGRVADWMMRHEENSQWLLAERILKDDGLYSITDISFAKTSQYLFVTGFGFELPEWAHVLGIRVRIDRLATQVGVRDEEVYLIDDGEIISDNLADTSVDWPFIETTKIYGSDGINNNPWRNPDSDDYLGEITAAEVNSPTFGVAMSVRSHQFLPTTLARVDYIGVEIFFEDPAGSIIRIVQDVDVRAKSPSYHYAPTSKILLRSLSEYKLGFRYVSSGLGADGNAEVNITGKSDIGYFLSGTGGVACGTEAKVTPFFENGTGGISMGGEAAVFPWVMLGGVAFGGAVSIVHHRHYVGSGSLVLGGASFTPEGKLAYAATGGVTLEGSSSLRASFWRYTSSGGIAISGASGIKASDLGTLLQQATFGMTVLQMSATFLDDVHVGNAPLLTASIAECGCEQLPLVMEVTHNIARGNNLAKFLARNNFTISRTLKLRYNLPNNSWQSNLHYRGLAADANTNESWDIVFELQCTEVMGGVDIGRNVWKLAVQMQRRNMTTQEDFETRVILGILPENLCGLNVDNLDFEVTYDTQLNLAIIDPTATIYQNTLFDNIGLFKNKSWIDNPNLLFRVTQSGTPKPQQRKDLTNVVLV